MPHEFALYTPELSAACLHKQPGDRITITDEQLWHRLKHVLRTAPGTLLLLFDRTTALEARLQTYEKKETLQFELISLIKKAVLAPTIIVMLPLLKREALAEAFYSCVELGASQIHLVTTSSSQQTWSTERDMSRCEKIMIAAAEQSKQFMLPGVKSPCTLADTLKQLPKASLRIHCDPQGVSLWKVLEQIEHEKPETIVLSFGPEADLTDNERVLLYQNQFVACALTPTVLRATQALVVALGALRSGSSIVA